MAILRYKTISGQPSTIKCTRKYEAFFNSRGEHREFLSPNYFLKLPKDLVAFGPDILQSPAQSTSSYFFLYIFLFRDNLYENLNCVQLSVLDMKHASAIWKCIQGIEIIVSEPPRCNTMMLASPPNI